MAQRHVRVGAVRAKRVVVWPPHEAGLGHAKGAAGAQQRADVVALGGRAGGRDGEERERAGAGERCLSPALARARKEVRGLPC